jgi:uncharacterized protein DUF1942
VLDYPAEQVVSGQYRCSLRRGTVTPLISDFNARAKDGTTYRVIDTVATPDGIPPTPINQGQRSYGKIYFDVTGPPPNGVVYNDGAQDFLISASNA